MFTFIFSIDALRMDLSNTDLISIAYFQISHVDRVLGICLLHCTGTTAGFLSSVKDKVQSNEYVQHENHVVIL